MGVTASAYLAVGGIEPLAALEDEALERRLARRRASASPGPPPCASAPPRASQGRAPRGLAADLALDDWRERRRFDAADVHARARVAADKTATVSDRP